MLLTLQLARDSMVKIKPLYAYTQRYPTEIDNSHAQARFSDLFPVRRISRSQSGY